MHRAIEIVEEALRRYAPPIYVRKEIVHNHYVVRDLERRGVVFVDSEAEVPAGARDGRTILLVGHEDHEEIEGTYGEAPDRTIVVADVADVARLDLPRDEPWSYLTQTTLSLDETADVIAGPAELWRLILSKVDSLYDVETPLINADGAADRLRHRRRGRRPMRAATRTGSTNRPSGWSAARIRPASTDRCARSGYFSPPRTEKMLPVSCSSVSSAS